MLASCYILTICQMWKSNVDSVFYNKLTRFTSEPLVSKICNPRYILNNVGHIQTHSPETDMNQVRP